MIEPAWLVAQAAPLICGESGSVRDLDHVIWGMRASVVMALIHYKLRAAGCWTVEPGESAGAVAARLTSAAQHGQDRIQT